MKTWKLVSGILSIIFSALVTVQACIVGLSNTLSKNGEVSGGAGIIVAIMLLSGGITSIVVRKGSIGGNIALFILYGIGALFGFSLAGNYIDLYLWSGWCLICAMLAIISIVLQIHRNKAENIKSNRDKSLSYLNDPKDYEMIVFQIIVFLGIFFIAVVIGMIIYRSFVPI